MRHPRIEAFEKKLKKVFDQIDHELEDRYGDSYPLHPARPSRHRTGNPEHDGLFNVGAAFSAGFGTRHGSGYVVEIRMATLADVPATTKREIAELVAQRLRKLLPAAFPNRHLKVTRDGSVFKIHGDLSIGSA